MAKPFSIQAPEDVAKEYGGNKQKIAQAAQLGIVDPTAAVLAGMFIDRMRSAQPQEMAQKPTIAQQVMGGAPSAPLGSSPSPGGLGAAPPMAPQGAPMPAPQQAPIGMADGGMAFAAPYTQGGLDGLPVPDTMFDEGRNGGFDDGYAGGGLVAFAEGAEVTNPLGPWFEERATHAIPGIGVTSRQRSAARNAQVGGVKNSYHLSNNARDFVPPKGMGMDALHAKLTDLFGSGYDIINEGNHVHVEPGDKHRATAAPAANLPERDTGTLAGQMGSSADIYDLLQKKFGASPEEQEANKALLTRARELSSPEYQEKRRKADMWQSLAEIGFNMASSQSPHFLQAVGEAAAAAMPGARADRKEREALKDRGLELLADMTGKSRKENLELWKTAVDVGKEHIAQKQFEQRMGLEREKLQADKETAALNRQTQKDIAEIGATSRMDKGLEGLMNSYLQMGINEAKGKGIPVDMPALRATAYQLAMQQWQKYMKPQATGGFDPSTGLPIPQTAGAPTGNTVDFSSLK